MILSLISAAVYGDPLEIGTPAPSVVTTDHEGKSLNLGEALAEGKALVFFYPKAMTPGCTKQACSLRDGYDQLTEMGVTIFGVSSDTAETQAEFREKHQLPFTLIADTDQAVSKAFQKGRWSRHAYLFIDGKLEWLDLSASTAKQAADVIEVLSSLES
ncbi:MAG: peroxiredoxin [Verrucomicrobiota bacterium]